MVIIEIKYINAGTFSKKVLLEVRKMSTKKLAALLCALLLLLGIMAGCSSGDKSGNGTDRHPACDRHRKADTGNIEPSDEVKSMFPLDEPVTFKIWSGPMKHDRQHDFPQRQPCIPGSRKTVERSASSGTSRLPGQRTETFNLIVTFRSCLTRL